MQRFEAAAAGIDLRWQLLTSQLDPGTGAAGTAGGSRHARRGDGTVTGTAGRPRRLHPVPTGAGMHGPMFDTSAEQAARAYEETDQAVADEYDEPITTGS